MSWRQNQQQTTYLPAAFLATLLLVQFPAFSQESRETEISLDPTINLTDGENHIKPEVIMEFNRMQKRSLDGVACEDFITDDSYSKKTVVVDLPSIGTGSRAQYKKLHEIHVRHNLKGTVEIQDSPDDFLHIEIRKAGASPDEVDLISHQHSLQDTKEGTVLLLQVDHGGRATSLLTIIGGVAAVLLLFSVIILVIWVYHKRHLETPASASTPNTRGRHGSNSSQGHVSPSRKAQVRTSVNSGTSQGVRRPGNDLNSPGRQRNRALQSERSKTSESTQPLALPPPPPSSRGHHRGDSETTKSVSPRHVGGGGSRAQYRGTMVTFTVLSLATVVYGALCPRQPRADVIIRVPKDFSYGSINVFFKKEKRGQLIQEHWGKQNATYKNILLFDVPSAQPTNNTVCSAKTLCPDAYNQGLAGCGIAKQQCLCSRGYRLSNGLCHDINECEEDRAACPHGIQCTNNMGSYVCNCPLGYFYRRGSCQRCSARCPDDHFEAVQCSATQDRVCKACTACTKGMYSVQPCGGSWDNHCIHAAHPVLLAKDETFPEFLHEIGLKLYIDKRRKRRLHSNWSDNVFVENLHNTRDLETIFYATAASEQQYDFWWVRESKVKVNIGLERINIFPIFNDVTHERSDNYYMDDLLRNVQHVDNKWFSRIRQKFCRYPIPDYYKITLEVATDRVTNATERVCRPNDHACLDRVTDFERNSYVDRALNGECKPYSAYPDPLVKHTNNVVCESGAKGLLETIFDLHEKPVKPIRNLPKVCDSNRVDCDRCLDSCASGDALQTSCCRESCLMARSCKIKYTRDCLRNRIACAAGDAYTFTLDPQFHAAAGGGTEDTQFQFQCHIRHRVPEILYRIWFYVSIPEINFDLPKVFREVYPSDVDSVAHGTYQMEFIDLEHNTIIDVDEDMIIVGREGRHKTMNYSLYPLKKPDEYEHKNFEIVDMGDGKNFATRVQFSEIFGYSTLSWGQDNHCDKNLTKFRSPQPHYRQKEGQNVTVIPETVKAPFKYYIQNSDKVPFLKFSTPANTSVLRWYFRNRTSALVIDDSLQVELLLQPDERLWNISLKGMLTECPGYLAITINDREDGAELFKYDTIVRCDRDSRASFNATFKIPQFGPQTQKTFDVILDDAKSEYRVFLTHVDLDEVPAKRVEEIVLQSEDKAQGIPMLLVCIVSVASVLMICVSSCFYLALTPRKQLIHDPDESSHYYDTLVAPPPNHRDTAVPPAATSTPRRSPRHQPSKVGCCTALRTMSSSRMLVVILYITFKVIYSFAFTFSIFFTILVLLIQGNLETITQVDAIQRRHHNESLTIQRQIEAHVQSEVKRQIQQVDNMQNACHGYLEDITETLAIQIDNHTDPVWLENFFLHDTSITSTVLEKYQRYLENYAQHLDNHEVDYQKHFNKELGYYFRKYVGYLDRSMLKNPWFTQWAHYLNESKERARHKTYRSPGEDMGSPIHGPAVDFAEYGHLEESMEVALWPVQFWERYHSMPAFEPVDKLVFSQPHCEPRSLQKLVAETNSVRDSVLFQYPPSDHPRDYDGPALNSAFSVQEFLEKLNLGVLRLVFFSMDLLLLFYRFTNLYLAVRSLCLGFEEHVHLTVEELKGHRGMREALDLSGEKQYTEQYIPLREGYLQDSSHHGLDDSLTTQLSDQDTLSSTALTVSSNHKTQKHHKPNGNIAHNLHLTSPPPTNGGTTSALPKPDNNMTKPAASTNHKKIMFTNGLQTIKTCLWVLLEGSLLPKFVFGTAILLILSIVINAAQTLLTIDSLLPLACFIPDLSGLRWHMDSANHYLTVVAAQATEAATSWYSSHMTADLSQLQTLQEFFNTDQARRGQVYLSELCAVRSTFYPNTTCSAQHSPPQLDLPMMPCNFVPLQPLLYRDHDLSILEDSIRDRYTPVVEAARTILLALTYGAVITASLALVVHAGGTVVLYYYRVRGVVPTRAIYVVPAGCVDPPIPLYGSVCTAQGTAREGAGLLSTDTTIAAAQYDTSYDTEEMDIDMDNSTATEAVNMSTSTSQVRFDPTQHARTVQFMDLPAAGSKTLPLQTSSPRIVPKSGSQTLGKQKASASSSSLASSAAASASTSSSHGKRTNPQALTDMGYSETKV